MLGTINRNLGSHLAHIHEPMLTWLTNVTCDNEIWILRKCSTDPRPEKLPLNKHHPESVGMNNDLKDTPQMQFSCLIIIAFLYKSSSKKLFMFSFFYLLFVYSLISSSFYFLFPVLFFPLKITQAVEFENFHFLLLRAHYFPCLFWGLILTF